MIKKFFTAIFVIFMIATAVWLAENKGSVTLNWLGYEITTSVAVLLGVSSLLFIILALGLYVVLTLLHLPLHWRDKKRIKRQKQGIDYAGKALVAIASQQGDLAESLAKKAHILLGEHALTLLLQAQAAQLQEKTARTTQLYTEMIKHPETGALGMRGLITNARKNNDTATTQKLITNFYHTHPTNTWATENFVHAAMKACHWEEAEQAVNKAIDQKILPRTLGQQLLQGIFLEKSRMLPASEALELLERAYRLAPQNIASVVSYAKALFPANEKRARTILYKAWKNDPHAMLAKAFQESVVFLDPFAAYKQIKYFVAPHPTLATSLLLLSHAEKQMGILGKAKELATASLRIFPSKEAYNLCAELAVLSLEKTTDIDKNRRLAEDAASIFDWSCSACHQTVIEWHAICPQCDGFMTLS
jgi:HemY protein